MQSSLLHLREDFDVFYLILRMFKKKKKKLFQRMSVWKKMNF